MTPRYKLRTLLILLAILPPLLWIGWTKYAAWRAERERLEHVRVWTIDGEMIGGGTVGWTNSPLVTLPEEPRE